MVKVKVRVRHVTVLLEKVVGVIVVVDNQMKVICPGLKPIKYVPICFFNLRQF